MGKKYTCVIAMLCCIVLLLAGCGGNQKAASVSNDKPVDSVQDAAASKATSGVEIFKEGSKYGLKKGSEIIADAIWEYIHEYQIGERYYYIVNLDKASGRYGLIRDDGEMIIKPSWNYLFYKGEHYVVGSMKGSAGNNEVIDVDTGETIVKTEHTVSKIEDHYAYISGYATALKGTGTGIVDILTGKSVCGLIFKGDPTYYPGVGFYGKVKDGEQFLFLSGKSVSGLHVIVYEEEQLILYGASDYSVADYKGESLGSFIVYKNWYTTEDGRHVVFGKLLKAGKQTDYILFDGTNRSVHVIPGAVKVEQFSDGMAVIVNADNLYGYVNDQGEIAYTYQFENAEAFKNGQAQVVSNYRKKTIDKNGDNKEEILQQGKDLIAKRDYTGAYELLTSITGYPGVSELMSSPEMIAARKSVDYKPGSIVTLGTYSKTPINWYVLDQKDDTVLLLSKDVLDYKSFHDYNYNKSASANWKTCSLRNWLNNQFISSALSSISSSIVVTNNGSGVEDKVFLLSKSEVAKYESLLKKMKPEYTATAAQARKKHMNMTYSQNNWLLRDSTATTLVCTETGYIRSSVSQAGYLGVRPAMWVKTSILP